MQDILFMYRCFPGVYEVQDLIVKLFKNGQNQAVRIPKAYEFKGVGEVTIRKEGNSIIITPAKKTWTSFAKSPSAEDDFMSSRPDILDTDSVKF